jgi:hypothetical protein
VVSRTAPLERLVIEAVRDQLHWRREFHPVDPVHIPEAVKRHPNTSMPSTASRRGTPGSSRSSRKAFPFSMRYQGHMNWETTLPGKNGQVLTFRKPKVFGIWHDVIQTGFLGDLDPGDRVVFTWRRD